MREGKPETNSFLTSSDPAEITSETPLESLNLNWTERDLPEATRTRHVHRLHPYLGKFIPQLVEVFLRKFFAAGQTVIDPFSGSGTTLVQANEMGINAVGCDVSQFNAILGRVKTVKYDLKRLHDELFDVLEQAKAQQTDSFHDLPLFRHLEPAKPQVLTSDDQYLNSWFAPRALHELLSYRAAVERGNYKYREVMYIILSRASRSARLTPHYDLDFPKKPQIEPYWCYKHRRTCQPTDEAGKFLRRYTHDTYQRIEVFDRIRTNSKIEIYHADSRSFDFPQADGVITSPPYVGLIDYHEQHAYAYHLLGLQDKRDAEIGAAMAGSSKKAREAYQQGIIDVFANTLRALPAQGRLIVIAGDRHNLYPMIAERLGIETEAVLQRHVNRRTGRRAGEFYESIFIWRKV